MADKEISLPKLRDEIDIIDDQILELLNKRAGFVLEVGRIKEKEGKKLFHVPEREEAIYKRLTEKNTGPFPENAIRPVYREIISASLAMEKPLKIACLGPEASRLQELTPVVPAHLHAEDGSLRLDEVPCTLPTGPSSCGDPESCP